MLVTTATDLPRLIACNGSRLMEDFTSSIGSDDTVKKEGDAVHWLVENYFHHKFPIGEEIVGQQAPNGIFITRAMIDDTVEYVSDIYNKGHVEYVTNHEGAKWRIDGRCDHFDIIARTLRVRDLKYGWTIVEPVNNWTLLSHAIALDKQFPNAFDHVELTIYQPRPYHRDGTVRTWQISVQQLREYAANLDWILSNLTDQLQTGPQCTRCPKLTNCATARSAFYNALEVAGQAFNDSVKNDVLSNLLDNVKRASEILEQTEKAYTELAHHRLAKGEVIKNYGLERKKTNTMWKPFVTPTTVKIMTGIDVTVTDMVTPKAAKDLGVPENIVASLTERHDKEAKVVRVDTNVQAQKMFKQTKGK